MRSQVILAFAVALATPVLLCPHAAPAQSSANSSYSNPNPTPASATSEAAQMVPAAAELTQPIDARKDHSGEQFYARLTDTVHLKNGTDLPKGTKLMGTISTDSMNPDGTSRLALRFTTADTKNGQSIPIVATIMGVAPPPDGFVWDASDATPPPQQWDGTTLRVDELGAASGFDLHSRIAGQNSGVLVSRKKDKIRLDDLTRFSLAIAPQGTGAENRGA